MSYRKAGSYKPLFVSFFVINLAPCLYVLRKVYHYA